MLADDSIGDLYNIIYDDSLYPIKLSEPADYPNVQPVDIGRQVVSKDMSDFFIQFMENDALGRIATLHQTLADIHDEGVFHPDCIKLAELHSTAVDFSKTGISVSRHVTSLVQLSAKLARLISMRFHELRRSNQTSRHLVLGC